MSNLSNLPRKIDVRINSDEDLTVIVRGMRMISPTTLQVAGTIDREDSQIINRGHKPKTNIRGCLLYVLDYHEYDDVPDSMCIDCQFTLAENLPTAR
jgi:hypothetical protein